MGSYNEPQKKHPYPYPYQYPDPDRIVVPPADRLVAADQGSSTRSFAKKSTAAKNAAGNSSRKNPKPRASFRLLCVIAHTVLDALGPDATLVDAIDEMKWAVAQARIEDPQPHEYGAVLDAVLMARSKGYGRVA